MKIGYFINSDLQFCVCWNSRTFFTSWLYCFLDNDWFLPGITLIQKMDCIIEPEQVYFSSSSFFFGSKKSRQCMFYGKW